MPRTLQFIGQTKYINKVRKLVTIDFTKLCLHDYDDEESCKVKEEICVVEEESCVVEEESCKVKEEMCS